MATRVSDPAPRTRPRDGKHRVDGFSQWFLCIFGDSRIINDGFHTECCLSNIFTDDHSTWSRGWLWPQDGCLAVRSRRLIGAVVLSLDPVGFRACTSKSIPLGKKRVAWTSATCSKINGTASVSREPPAEISPLLSL